MTNPVSHQLNLASGELNIISNVFRNNIPNHEPDLIIESNGSSHDLFANNSLRQTPAVHQMVVLPVMW